MYEDMKARGGGTADPENPYLKPCDNQDQDTYFIHCTEHIESPYLKAIWSKDIFLKSLFYVGLFQETLYNDVFIMQLFFCLSFWSFGYV